ncbi:MAG: hypothetical protein ABJO02_03320 [Reichenbachiella sp.]|uniref:hypothetical protein n=1 Tax=Reichenbachiella sp. TaxID=2184521 RepID=UPI003298CF2A
MKSNLIVLTLLLSPFLGAAQDSLVFNGQLSAFGSYAPNNDLEIMLGGRYIPELSYAWPMKKEVKLDVFASANIYGNTMFHPFDSSDWRGDLQPYRVWARYLGEQFEFRVGLQKIDFGVATVLRPLQWFNQVDPRDPLGITNGVYAALGRYYFLNNANIWLWVLYGNDDLKGFELMETSSRVPEFGGRIQLPIPRGEIGMSYHHRNASSEGIQGVDQYNKIPENRYGLDVKWDVNIGLWLEASHIHKSENVGIFTNQTLLNIGMDYTFGVGSGLNVVVEHLISSADEKSFEFDNTNNATAMTMSYPLGLWDNLSLVSTYNWETSDMSFFMNLEHQFPKFAGYVMLFYNPDTPASLIENEIDYSITGPGIRLMVVYNH